MKDKQWAVNQIDNAGNLTDAEWFQFEEEIGEYWSNFPEDKSFFDFHDSEYGKKLFKEMQDRRMRQNVKNPKTREFIKRIIGTGKHTTDEEFLQLRSELIAHLETLSKEERDEFAQLGYGEMLEMCCPPERVKRL